MFPTLSEGREYSGSGNAFSRSFLVATLAKEGKRLLHVFDSMSDARHFADVRNFVRASDSVRVISDARTFWEFHAASEGEFVSSYSVFESGRYSENFAAKKIFTLKKGDALEERTFVEKLLSFGYGFSEYAEDPGTYRREGDTAFLRLASGEYAVSFFDAHVEEIRKIRNLQGTSAPTKEARPIEVLKIPDRTPAETFSETLHFFDPKTLSGLENDCVILHDADFSAFAEDLTQAFPRRVAFYGIPRTSMENLAVEEPEIDSEETLIELLTDPKNRFEFFTKRPEPVKAAIKASARSDVRVSDAPKSLRLESFSISNPKGGRNFFLSDDVLAPIFVRDRTGTSVAGRMDLLLKIAPGDHVVHRDHGVGVFRGCERKTVGTSEREFVRVEYAGSDVLFVPLSEAYRLSKYLGEDSPPLSKLGGTEWKKAVERAEEDAEKVARELLDIYAKRKIAHRPAYRKFQKEEAAFLRAFPHEHTADQKNSIQEILSDLENNEPMDRLLSGDVGFGKTEVAMNAAYRAVLNGKQVAFVSPLVVLAYEHFDSLKKRFDAFGVRIAVLTRFSKESEERSVLKGLRGGSVDIVIGTHRLLSLDVRFAGLGLLIVDEEHRFWVLDKEKIAAMRESVDILSLSATPIPRSLNLALSGVRKVSILTTPPPRKKPIQTMVSRWTPEIVRSAVEFELARGGQVIVLHNRVKTLAKVEEEIRRACAGIGRGTEGESMSRKERPDSTPLKIATVHGQMPGIELEDRIIEFKERKYDILLSTTVIENGVNFLSANTILIDEADEFGLASLHQLRGRVGRKDVQAHCHLLYRKDSLADDAKRRLVAIAGNSHLGAGFEISMRDLEIRGAGEILGLKQSGRTKETGLPLYFRLLEEKVNELSKGVKRPPDAKIDLDVPYGVPDAFFDSEIDKLHFFRSLESVTDERALESARFAFSEREATLPLESENLFLLIRARIRLTALKVATVKRTGSSYVFEFAPGTAVADLRKFLELDTGQEFIFTGNGKIRTDAGNFRNDADFLKFLVSA